MSSNSILPNDGSTAVIKHDETCRFYLSRKKRFCRLQKMNGRQHCVQHVETHVDNSLGQPSLEESYRMRCPLDPSHTCDKRKLQKHLKNCNKTKLIPKDLWYVAGINSGEAQSDADLVKMLRDVPASEIEQLITKIRSISTELPHISNNNDKIHSSMEANILKFENCDGAMKKLIQNASLLAILESNNVLMCPCNYIEFGAGRGQLTASIIEAIPQENVSKCCFVLVDRGTNRRKLDSKHRLIGHIEVMRLRTDIKDLCLERLEVLQNSNPVVGVSKHLCGCATDLSLRCIVNSMTNITFTGALIALCCHHRCNWSDYVGKDFFQKFSLTPRDFSIITLMTSWAVCCFRNEGESKNDDDKGPLHFVNDIEKEEIGVLCKRLIDAGRVDYLSKIGFDARLIEYANKSVTLENIALLLRNKCSGC